MNQEATLVESNGITLWDLVMGCGTFGMSVILVSVIVILISIPLVAMKQKRLFAIFLLDFCIKLCLLTSGCLFFSSWVKIGLLGSHPSSSIQSMNTFFQYIWEANSSPMILFGIAWVAFVIKSAVKLKVNFANQSLQPAPLDASDEIETQDGAAERRSFNVRYRK